MIAEMVEPGSRVLDLGCGEGELLAWLRENKRVEARGVEIETEQGPQSDCTRRFRAIKATLTRAWPIIQTTLSISSF